MARFAAILLICFAVVSSLATRSHKFKSHQRAFQRHRSSQNVRDLFSVLPDAGRINGPAAGAAPAVKLTSNPSRIADGGSVTIFAAFQNWTPTPDDFVTVSCGPTSGYDDFLDSIVLVDIADGSSVNVTFTGLVYMRCDYMFVYVGATYFPNINYTALGSLTVPSIDSPGTPKQGHLSYLNDPTSMAVQYVSGTNQAAPSVRVTQAGKQTPVTFVGTSQTYTAGDMCHAPANQTAQQWFRSPGFLHTVKLTGLAPSTTYSYQYGNDQDGWSTAATFHTAPSEPRGVTFVAYGDQSTDAAAVNTSLFVAKHALNGLDFVVHFGDLGYALGNAWVWDTWGTLISPGASMVPYMVSVGNHEYDYDKGREHDPSNVTGPGDGGFLPDWWNNGAEASQGECGVPVYYRFAGPPTGNSIFWYSFTYGNVFVIQFSSEHDFQPGSRQYQWLEATLQSVDRAATPWVVVTMHRPIYTTQECETGDYVVGLHIRAALDPLFYKYRVNVALVAHTHAYERTCPVFNGTCTPDGVGTVHLTVGSAGAGLEGCGYSPRYGNFSLSHINAWGVLLVTTTNQQMHLQFVLDLDSTVYDEAYIKPWPNDSKK